MTDLFVAVPPIKGYRLVGERFRPPAEIILAGLDGLVPVVLQREPRNTYDGNAIRVLLVDREPPFHLGYIKREDAMDLAQTMDGAGQTEVGATLYPAQRLIKVNAGQI